MSGRDAIEKWRDGEEEFFCVVSRSDSAARVTPVAAKIFFMYLFIYL